MYTHEGTRHGRVARQEEGAAFFDETREAVTNGVDPHVRPAVANSNDDRSWFTVFFLKKDVTFSVLFIYT